jgi:uncharacterized protein
VSHRIVFDTNTRISAIIFGGKPRELISHACPPEYLQIVSQPLLDELHEILDRKFHWPEPAISKEMRYIATVSFLVKPDAIDPVCRDPDDDRILECAIAGNADFIITGDRDLLTLGSFRGIPILTVRQYLDRTF